MTLKDGVTYQVRAPPLPNFSRMATVPCGLFALPLCHVPPQPTLTSCATDCNRTDPPISVTNSRLNYPDKYRLRQRCGMSGLCNFLWSITNANGTLLAPPNLTMTSPFLIPPGAAFLSFGYSQINYCSTAGEP